MFEMHTPMPAFGHPIAASTLLGGFDAPARRAEPKSLPTQDALAAGLSSRTTKLVRQSWAVVMPISDSVASLFYERLFELDPSARPLFKGDLREQKKLVQTLAIVIDSLSNLDKLVPLLESLGVRNARAMVQERHYDLAGRALLGALREGLGDAFTPEVEAAWRRVYAFASETMRGAASHRAPPAASPSQPKPPGAQAKPRRHTPAVGGGAVGLLLGALCLVFSMIVSGFVAIAIAKGPSWGAFVITPLATLALTVTAFSFGHFWARSKGDVRRGG